MMKLMISTNKGSEEANEKFIGFDKLKKFLMDI